MELTPDLTQDTTETSQEQGSESLEAGNQSQEKAPSVVELDALEKFRFGGRDWTPKDLSGAILMQSDYTRKTQALAEERKFNDNLQTDLDAVKRDPSLVARFREIYPEKFHAYLDTIGVKASSSLNANTQDPQLLSRLEAIESEFQERKVEAISAELDAKYATLTKKYPFADEEMVTSRAMAFLDKMQKEQGSKANITEAQWDMLFKQSHDRMSEMAKKFYGDRIKNQKEANQRGKDVPAGGGVPGQAPKQPRSIKEATTMALRDMEQLN